MRPVAPSPETRIVLATRSRGKIEELKRLTTGLSLEIHTADDYPGGPVVDETEPTLEGNALKKARAWNRYTGLPAVADDTGLEVEALGGAPGVRSARYAGVDASDEQNRARLLVDLRPFTEIGSRRARFRTVVALVGEEELTFEGVCDGHIRFSETGSGGFGYDALFEPVGTGRTFAEMTLEEKNRISHRARAMAKLRGHLAARKAVP